MVFEAPTERLDAVVKANTVTLYSTVFEPEVKAQDKKDKDKDKK